MSGLSRRNASLNRTAAPAVPVNNASVIRSASLAGYMALAAALQLPADALLRRVGLSRQLLEQPDQPIALGAVCELLELSAQHSGCESFGLRLSAGRRLANLGTVSIVLREQSTGLQALHTLSRYLRLVNPSLATQVELAGDVVLVRESIVSEHRLPVRQPLEMAVGVMHGILRELLSVPGEPWKPKRVCFRHRAPIDVSDHRKLLGCPMEFNAEFDGLVCHAADLERELPDRDSARAHGVQWALDQALRDAEQNTQDTVRQLIAVLLPQGECSVTRVAVAMGIDRRTLARYLAAQGMSFTTLLHAVRGQLAQRQLASSDHSIGHIAQLLGFGSTSAFAHWFSEQHQMSAQQWRSRLSL